MKIKILDWNSRGKEVEIGKIEKVMAMYIQVISGDEVLCVFDKKGNIHRFDSSDTRTMNYYDGEYKIYDNEEENNLVNNPEWVNRKSSYSFC